MAGEKLAGYHYLTTFCLSTIIYDLTVEFYKLHLYQREHLRLREQAIHAARSGRQNIAEGYMEKSLKSYIMLLGVAKASLEELLLDFQDYLRQRKLPILAKDDSQIREIRAFRVIPPLVYTPNSPNYPNFPKNDPALFANTLITLISQNIFLLDKQISSLEVKFTKEGGYTENLFKKRLDYKRKGN